MGALVFFGVLAVITDVPYSNQAPMEWGNSPTVKTVGPEEVFQETAYVGDTDTWDRDNGKSYPVLCNGGVSLHKTITSGQVQSTSSSFDDVACKLTGIYTIKANDLAPGDDEETYTDEHWGKDNNTGVLQDANGGQTLLMTCLVTIRRATSPPTTTGGTTSSTGFK